MTARKQFDFNNKQTSHSTSDYREKPTISNESRKGFEKKTFIIHHNLKLFQITLDCESTIEQLNQAVFHRVQFQLDSKFICLQSINKNEMIDYYLLCSNQKVKVFRKNQSFKIYSSNYQTQSNRPSVSDFIFLKCLGQGGSASVYLVRHKSTGKLYALKQIDKQYFIEFKRMEQILREKKILSEIVNEFAFIIKLYASFESERHLNFVLEYYPGGELFLHLQRKRLNENQAKLYFCQMLLAFEFLHKNRIVYRDLKPENIMIDYQGHAKLADFGLCKLNLTTDQFTHSFCGSLQYMAPEVKDNQGYNYSVDFYTLGAFLFEMVVGVPPYYNQQTLYFPQKLSKSLIELIKGLIEKDVNKRIDNFHIIKKSPWLELINWQQIYNKKYQMPLKLNIYQTYIHQQFSKIKVDSMNLMKEEKFDRLFDMFYYLRGHDDKKNNQMPFSILDKKSEKKISRNKSKSRKSQSKSKQSKEKSNIPFNNKTKFKKSLSNNKSEEKNDSLNRKPLLKLPERLGPERLQFTKGQNTHVSPPKFINQITQSKSSNQLLKNTNFRIQSPSFKKAQHYPLVQQPRAIYFRKG